MKYRTERVMSRNNITRDDFLKRNSLQWTDENKKNMTDYIIQNNSDLKSLEKEAKKIFDSIL
jgi:dephospho-CoA kinase